MENVCKTYFSTGRTPAQNPRANCFLHKPISCKIWACKQRWISVSREMRLVPPTQPLAVLCLMHQQGFFSRLNRDVSICTLLSSPGRRAQQSSLSNKQKCNFFFVFYLLYLSPCLIYHTIHTTPIICLQGQLDGSRTHGLCKSSVSSILHKVCFYINIWAFLVRL